jgi:hypothetical protein
MRVMTLREFLETLSAQQVPREYLAFKCPICGTIQCAADLIAAGAGADFESVEGYIGFSCVGRWTGAGPHQPGTEPGRGCDWTLGGLFQLHKLEVIVEDGTAHPHFEPATPAEAQAHMAVRSAMLAEAVPAAAGGESPRTVPAATGLARSTETVEEVRSC